MFRRRRLVRLHLKNDPRAIEGILTHLDRDHYYLEHTRIIMAPDRAKDVPVDGRAWWPRRDVLYLQELG